LTLGLSPVANAQEFTTREVASTQHVLNFDDVAMTDLIEDISVITGYTFIVHPDVKSKRVTVSSNAALTTDRIFDVFLSTLRVHGFAAVPAGKDIYRIVPEQSAVGEARLNGTGENAFITDILKLENVNAIQAAQMVKPIVDSDGQVVANAASNTLVVVDYASNLPRIRELVSRLDANETVTETISLTNMPAPELESILQQLNETNGEDAYRKNFKAIASDTGNTIVLSGDPGLIARAHAVAIELDKTDRTSDTLRVIALNNADADEIVPILEQVSAAMQARSIGSESAPASTIAHHASTNSLIISAPNDTLMAMERVITQLDKRRAQVLVEAIIVEMSDDTARELGVQFLLSGTGGDATPFASTNFSRSAPNLLTLAGALAGDSLFEGDNQLIEPAVSSLLGLTGATFGVGGQSGDTLFGAIINAVDNDTNSRILSKPFNLTLDNGTSSLLVGQDVPIATGQVLGDDFSNPFQTVERKEIGIKLDVTPRISSDNTVRLDILQEVSSIDGAIGTATPDLIFNKREIETSVIADDGEIIVIGGLIEQTDTLANSKVPVLGDIPGIGRAFRSEGTAQQRTNLMVFIRPTIIRDTDSARAATARSYRYIKAEELWRGNGDAADSLDMFIEDVLGAAAPG
jgi:general secretion pathway protein D